jgi:hypothetical protein
MKFTLQNVNLPLNLICNRIPTIPFRQLRIVGEVQPSVMPYLDYILVSCSGQRELCSPSGHTTPIRHWEKYKSAKFDTFTRDRIYRQELIFFAQSSVFDTHLFELVLWRLNWCCGAS